MCDKDTVSSYDLLASLDRGPKKSLYKISLLIF